MDPSTPDERSFVTARVFAATPEQVYAAFSDAQRLARWWGPAGFSNRFEVFEFRPGGRWVFDMIGPDGKVYRNTSQFLVLEPGQRVVLRHDCAPLFTFTATLTPAPQGGTRLHWDQVFDDADVARAVRAIVGPANEQNLDRLGAELGVASWVP